MSSTHTKEPIHPEGPGHYPPSTPGRNLYLLARATIVLFTAIQLICVSVAAGKYGHVSWLNPTLSPAITAFIYSGIEIIAVWHWNVRSYHLTRVFYDGLIACGFAVASGFLGDVALPWMKGEMTDLVDGEVCHVSGKLGITILTFMLLVMLLEAAICAEGIKDTIKIHCDGEGCRHRRCARGAAVTV